MPKPGTWGNGKCIVVLPAKDERRHQAQCKYYRKSDKHCCARNLRCTGSAHCPYYEKMRKLGE